MPREIFEQFRQFVLSDLSVQETLREIDEREEFIVRVVELAARRNFEITNADVEEAMRDGRRAWLEKWI